MRKYSSPRRTLALALLCLIGCLAFTSHMIRLDQKPDWAYFPWIVGGWAVSGLAALWVAAVAAVNTAIWGRREFAWRTLRRPKIPQEQSPEDIRATGEHFKAGIRTATTGRPDSAAGDSPYTVVNTVHVRDRDGDPVVHQPFLPRDPAYATRMQFTGTLPSREQLEAELVADVRAGLRNLAQDTDGGIPAGPLVRGYADPNRPTLNRLYGLAATVAAEKHGGTRPLYAPNPANTVADGYVPIPADTSQEQP